MVDKRDINAQLPESKLDKYSVWILFPALSAQDSNAILTPWTLSACMLTIALRAMSSISRGKS